MRRVLSILSFQVMKRIAINQASFTQHLLYEDLDPIAIRDLLLPLLDDPHRKICTAIGMAVASIAHYDWPEDWPDLLPSLMKCITDQTNMNAVHGALRCFALVSADLDDNMVPKLVPVLFPCLHTIVSSPQIYEKPLRMKALSIVYACTSMLGAMSGVYKTETSAMMSPMLQSWINQFSSILEHPVQSEDPDDWSIRMEVIKCLNQFLQNFPSLMESQFGVFMGPLWQTFVSSLGVYTRSSIDGIEDPYDGRYDSDGAEQSLESFIIQLFEFLLTILGIPKFVKVVGNNVKELVYYTIAFMQTTEQQVNAWSVDANQFVADEDDNTYSCRASELCMPTLGHDICMLSDSSILEFMLSLTSAKTRFRESQQEKASGASGWWRMREATLFALASVSEQLLEAEAPEITKVRVNEYPFLYARIFSSIAKFSSMVSQGLIEHFLYAAVKALGMDMPPPVKVGASKVDCLLPQASDETMHLVLETLQEAVKAGPDLVVSIEPVLLSIILICGLRMLLILLSALMLLEFRLPWCEISIIGELPNLEILKLLSRAFEGDRWEVKDAEFPKLKYLKLDNINFSQWSISDDAFPELEYLSLTKCERLEEIPSHFGEAMCIKSIEVNRCGSSVANSALEIQTTQHEEMANDAFTVTIQPPDWDTRSSL
ncbi:hypothetical protein KY290_026309 [Solanum tuberosum]|uniref:Importin-9 n=1 Tax=Solanum tuberosum TaxID=4113 RepID=A0ABQ7UXQ6_SOLTU|nr:hypothetical protein KY290_026309 [Solanum tuberosum]